MNGSEMMKYEDVKDGFIWESRIIDKDITISKDDFKGDFFELVTLANVGWNKRFHQCFRLEVG